MIPSVRLWAGALAVLAGCRSVPSREPTCEPASGPLPATADAATLSGEYRLRMERPGNSAPTIVVGSLTLVPTDDSLRYGLTRGGNIDSSIVQPLHGTTDIDLEAVGALTAGDTRSTEPRWPGVLVVQWPAPPSGTQIVLRLGAEGNRRG